MLKGGGNLAGNHYNHWEVDEVPRYQMLVIGEEIMAGEKNDTGEKLLEFVPSEAIVWFAPRNSDIKDPSKRTPMDWTWSERDVPVLAWQTTDRYILKELYECALFYVVRDCKNGGVISYKEFLNDSDQQQL